LRSRRKRPVCCDGHAGIRLVAAAMETAPAAGAAKVAHPVGAVVRQGAVVAYARGNPLGR